MIDLLTDCVKDSAGGAHQWQIVRNQNSKRFLLQNISLPQYGGQSLPVSKVRILQVQGTLCEKAF